MVSVAACIAYSDCFLFIYYSAKDFSPEPKMGGLDLLWGFTGTIRLAMRISTPPDKGLQPLVS